MAKLTETTKKMLVVLFVLCVIAVAIACGLLALYACYEEGFLVLNFLKFALGIAIGFAYSCVKLILLEKSVEKCINMESADAGAYTRRQYMLRYFLSFAVLVAAALISPGSLLGAAIAMLLVQPAALISGRLVKNK